MIITTKKQRADLIEAGKRLAAVLAACAEAAKPGVRAGGEAAGAARGSVQSQRFLAPSTMSGYAA